MDLSLNMLKEKKRPKRNARTGTRTRVACLGSMHANRYTIRADDVIGLSQKSLFSYYMRNIKLIGIVAREPPKAAATF